MNEQHFRRFDSMVRRADVSLRALFPDLVTRIFGLQGGHYVICPVGSVHGIDTMRLDFEKVRPAGLAIQVADAQPQSFAYELSPIEDGAVADNFEGFGFSRPQLINLLLARFPSLPLSDAPSSSTDPITLFLDGEADPTQLEAAQATLQGILPGFRFAFDREPAPRRSFPPDVQRRLDELTNIDVKPAKRRPTAPPFVKADEEFWYNSVEDVLAGRLSQRSILDMSDDGMACYMDATVGSQFDLRQAILLYDTVYLTPPVISPGANSAGFWEEQALTKKDLFALIAAGRLRLILSQPEERTDPDFLREACSIDPRSVIGRLKSSALVASDIVATAREYRFADPAMVKQLSIAAQALSEEVKIAPSTVMRSLLWPLSARRSCVGALTSRGLMGLPSFGMGGVLAEEIKQVTGRDLQLEALVTTMGVQIAHSLHATFIPPMDDLRGWNVPRLLIGERLNFFRDYNSRTAAAWAVDQRRKFEKREIIMPPLPIFRFENHADVHEIIAATSSGSTRRKGRAMVSRLSALTSEERSAAIDAISRDFYSLNVRRQRSGAAIDLVSNIIDVATSLFQVSIFPFKSAWGLLGTVASVARKNPRLDLLLDTIEADLAPGLGINEDLAFLSKVNRVAKLND